MDGRCGTCKWWRNVLDPDFPLDDPGGECQLTIWTGRTYEHVDSKALAFPDDDETYASLITDPDFGCVQWEAKS